SYACGAGCWAGMRNRRDLRDAVPVFGVPGRAVGCAGGNSVFISLDEGSQPAEPMSLEKPSALPRKVSVVIEQDEHGCYAWCPELKGCQSQGKTIEEALTNVREAIELFLETLSENERATALSQQI